MSTQVRREAVLVDGRKVPGLTVRTSRYGTLIYEYKGIVEGRYTRVR